jgi:hypothetical protein
MAHGFDQARRRPLGCEALKQPAKAAFDKLRSVFKSLRRYRAFPISLGCYIADRGHVAACLFFALRRKQQMAIVR